MHPMSAPLLLLLGIMSVCLLEGSFMLDITVDSDGDVTALVTQIYQQGSSNELINTHHTKQTVNIH